MMTKNNPSSKAIFRKIAAVPLFLILAITLAFSQEIKQKDSVMNFENTWWSPFLKKHGFNIDKNKFENLFVADNIILNSDQDRRTFYKNARFAFNEGDTAVFIVEAPKAVVSKDGKSFEFSNGKDYRYYKNGDFMKGEFELMKITK